ncbi:MAG: FecR family protein [Woeseia sp.]
MNETPNTDAGRNERMLEEILRHAEPRPRPADAAAARAYEALHDEWQAATRQTRWRRRASYIGIAATLLLVVFAGMQWNNSTPAPAKFLQLTVLRATGSEVQHNATQHLPDDLANSALTLRHGDVLATAHDSRLALAWDSGSLRIDEDTRVRFDNAQTLTLLAGTLYFDSTPFGNVAGTAAQIEIDTAFGRVSHVGTQFQVGMSDNALQVSVREGAVRVAGERIDVTLVRGEGIALTKDGYFERQAVATYDTSWQWAADIAPEQQLAGRTTAEVLQWIARETGREIRFRNEAARELAASEPRGIAALAPLPALRTIPFMTSLQYSLSDGYIVVDVAVADDGSH